jgi:hypothetical protein
MPALLLLYQGVGSKSKGICSSRLFVQLNIYFPPRFMLRYLAIIRGCKNRRRVENADSPELCECGKFWPWQVEYNGNRYHPIYSGNA